MPVNVGLSSITGISTVTVGSDAVYKEYIDNKLGASIPSIYGNENEDTLSYEQHGKLNLVCKHCMVHNKSLLTIGTTL